MKPLDWDVVRRWIALFVAIVVIIATVILAFVLWLNRFDPIVLKNAKVIIGLPIAAAVSFVIVVFFKQSETPVVVKLYGIELSGSSGEVFLWVVTFVCISLMIHLLWVN
jgi:hypothetical protein